MNIFCVIFLAIVWLSMGLAGSRLAYEAMQYGFSEDWNQKWKKKDLWATHWMIPFGWCNLIAGLLFYFLHLKDK